MFYGCAYGCEVKYLALTLKFGFDSVYFDIGELVTNKFFKSTWLKIVLEFIHACC